MAESHSDANGLMFVNGKTFCATYRLFKQFLFGIVLVGDLWNHTIWDMIEYDSTADNFPEFFPMKICHFSSIGIPL